MGNKIKAIIEAIRGTFSKTGSKVASGARTATTQIASTAKQSARRYYPILITAAVLGTVGYAIYRNPPVQTVQRGEAGIRANLFTGNVEEFREGSVIVLPMIHDMRRLPLRDLVYQPSESASAEGSAPFQSVEGLSIGIDLSIRYALDPAKLIALSKELPENFNEEVIQPATHGIVYKTFARYTVREIFSSKRADIQQSIETELKAKLANDGVILRSVHMGKVDLPANYRAGMEKLIAEELETEKMRYTLTLKERKVKESELEAEAAKVRREKAAEAAAREQIIAAKAQEEAMKHVLPFKQKQIEQRQLEAEAERQAKVKTAEGSAQARRIEAQGEADSRQKLADAEAYRLDRVGKINSEQMAREGELISKHPLLIQKALADKLSDKVSVIIAPPSTNGDFIGNGLLGNSKQVAMQNK